MTDLTEQLYAGTLPTGHYYFNNGVETYIVLYKNINSKHLILQEPEGLTVLSEVPSYEEVVKLKKDIYKAGREIDELTFENAQLKKWCEEFNALNVAKENTKLKTDCRTLAQTLLKVRPEHKAWLEKNYKEYL